MKRLKVAGKESVKWHCYSVCVCMFKSRYQLIALLMKRAAYLSELVSNRSRRNGLQNKSQQHMTKVPGRLWHNGQARGIM